MLRIFYFNLSPSRLKRDTPLHMERGKVKLCLTWGEVIKISLPLRHIKLERWIFL